MTTVQPSSAALGVALVGVLYEALVPVVRFGGAAAVTLAVETPLSMGAVVGSRTLPDLR